MRTLPTAILLLGALGLAPAAIAQTESSLPAARTVAGVKYVQGGIGRDEAAAMMSEARNYPLAVVFSGGTDNHFVANVELRVRDASGRTVLQTHSEGPIVLVDLPAGKYLVDAEYRGKAVQRSAELSPKRAARLDFHWTDND